MCTEMECVDKYMYRLLEKPSNFLIPIMLAGVVGCNLSDGPDNDAELPPSGSGNSNLIGDINGPLTGDVWVAKKSGSFRFNMRTGVRTPVGEGRVYPSANGTLYADVTETGRREIVPGCEDRFVVTREDEHRVEIKRSSNDQTLGSFLTLNQINSPVRLSPDAQRMAVSGIVVDCGSNVGNILLVMAMDGTVIHQAEFDPGGIWSPAIEAFDFTPDGKLVLARRVGEQQYDLEIETAPHTYVFETHIRFTLSDELERVRRLRSNADGTKFLLEAIIDELPGFTGFSARSSSAVLLDLTAQTIHSVFSANEDDNELRANEALFSPDGDWVLTTHKYESGVVFLTNNSGAGSDIFTDIAAIPVPPTGVAYAVPVETVGQLLPPLQVSDNIRPVVSVDGSEVTAVGFDPFTDQSWTPSVE